LGNIHRPPSPQESETEEPIIVQLNTWVALLTLIIGVTLLGFNTSFAVDSIDGLTSTHLSASFVGLILLPLLSIDLMPIKCARLDKLDLTIMASAGKALQTSVLITPLIVVIGWIMGIEEMGLLFDEFQVISLFVAVLLFSFQISGGKSN
jgi:Ca2+:H+ antiporter